MLAVMQFVDSGGALVEFNEPICISFIHLHVLLLSDGVVREREVATRFVVTVDNNETRPLLPDSLLG